MSSLPLELEKSLRPRWKEAWYLRQQGMSLREVGILMKVKTSTIILYQSKVRKAIRKLNGEEAPPDPGADIKDMRVIQGRPQTAKDLRDEIMRVASTALHAITEQDLEGVKAHQKAIVFGIAFDKLRLLDNEPTSIYRVEDHRKMDELATFLLKEAKRRGYDIYTDPVTGEAKMLKDITPVEAEMMNDE